VIDLLVVLSILGLLGLLFLGIWAFVLGRKVDSMKEDIYRMRMLAEGMKADVRTMESLLNKWSAK
jgi:hypothetical protein